MLYDRSQGIVRIVKTVRQKDGRKKHEWFLKSVISMPAYYGTAVLWWLVQMGLLIKMGDTAAWTFTPPKARKGWFHRSYP